MTDSGGKTVAGSPEWLPPGWVEQLKVLRSGREVRCYLNVATMQKFFSKEDVMHFVTKESHSLISSQPNSELIKSLEENQSAAKNTDNAEENTDWLPSGWITEAKSRMSGRRIGDKYYIYVDPSSGRRFYSKLEVLRYLETTKTYNCSAHDETPSGIQPCRNQDVNTPTDRVTEARPEAETTKCLEIEILTENLPNQTKDNALANNVLACKHDMEGLPPGWIKGIKARKKGSTVKSDPFYIDPVSGYMFRSRKDVYRYLETGDIKSCKIKPQRKDVSDPVLSEDQSLPLSGDGQQLEAAPKALILADKNISDASSFAFPKSGSTKKSPSEHMSADSFAAKEVESPQNKDSLEIVNGNCNKSNVICSNASAVAVSNSDASARNGSMRVKKSKRQGGPNMPRRASKRLAGLEPELLADSASGKQAHSASRQSPKIVAEKLGLSDTNMSEDGSKQPFAVPDVGLIHHASLADTSFCGQPTDREDSSLEGQSTKEQLPREMETNGIDDIKPIPKFVNQFSNSISDPCLKFPLEAARSEMPKGAIANNEPSSTFIDVPQERTRVSKKGKDGRGGTCTKLSNGNRKEAKLPSQLSKRRTGFQSYEEVNLSTEKAIQFVSSNSGNNGARLDASFIQNNIADVASQKFKAFSGTGNANQVSTYLKCTSPESSNRIFESPAHSNVQRQDMEATKLHGQAESGLHPQLGDSWTDPCLDFAIKTLTGAIPVPETVCHSLVSSTVSDVFKENLADGRNKTSKKVESNKSKNNSKLVLPFESSEEVAKVKRGKVDRSGSAEYLATSSSALKLDTGLFHDNIFERAIPKFEAAPPTVLADQAFSHSNIPFRQEATNNTLNHGRQNLFDRALTMFEAAPTGLANQAPSHNSIPVWPESSHNTSNLERQIVPGPGEQLQKQESVRMSLENLDSQFFLPFGEPWYDPCLEFAFKTLTGAIPVDDNLAVQDYLSQHQLGTMQPHRDCAPLPDFNLPNVPQNDVPKHIGASDKNMFRQQQNLESPIYTPANVGSSSQHKWQEADKGNVKF